MNILQVLPELKSGGVERGTVDLAKYLKAQGHRSVVVSGGGPLVGDLTSAGVIHYTLPVHKKSFFSVIRCVKALSKIVELEAIDVIHARSRVPAWVAFFTSRKTNVPFVTTCHGFYSKHLFSHVMGWGKLVIVGSHVIGKRMRDDFGVSHEKIRLIPRGVNLSEFKLRADAASPIKHDRVVGLVGRLTPIKGHPLFLKAMARVARLFPDIRIQIIGDAPKQHYKEELQLLARRLGLGQCVEFLGTRYDIPELLKKMTVLVIPSVGEEAFGRVAIEAGACGVPVVATRIGGLVDIIEDEKDGLLTPPDDPRLLSEAIIRLLKDAELCKKLADSLRRRVETEFNSELMFKRTLRVYEEAVSKKKILVIKMSAIGDVILSIPSLKALRLNYPDAWISVLVGKKSKDIIRNCPYVNDRIVYQPPGGFDRWMYLGRMAGLLAKEDFDVVIDLQNNNTSHALSFLSGARIRAGHDNGKWSFFLNRKSKVSARAAISPLEHQFSVLRLLDLKHFEGLDLELWTEKKEEGAVQDFLNGQWVSPTQPLVGINLTASPRWQTKKWPLLYFAKLCDELAKRNIRVVVTGSEEDKNEALELLSLTTNRPINAVGKTSVTELVALIRRCQVFISSDSAPMHIAAGLDVPLIALFGPTDPKRHLVASDNYQVFWKEISCSPCYLRTCPIGHLCMKKISVGEVLESTLHFLRNQRSLVGQEAI